MRSKEEILKDLGIGVEHTGYGGYDYTTIQIVAVELLIDLRDILERLTKKTN